MHRCTALATALVVCSVGALSCIDNHALDEAHITGGSCASTAAAPWQVSVAYRGRGEWTHTCGGIVVDREWVLTAGHCVTVADTGGVYMPRTLGVIAGLSLFPDYPGDPDDNPTPSDGVCTEVDPSTCSWGQVDPATIVDPEYAEHGIDVTRIVRHPGYCRSGIQPGWVDAHDLAMLRLATPLPPASVIDRASDGHDVAAGSQVVVTGWGLSYDAIGECRAPLRQGLLTIGGLRTDRVDSSDVPVEWLEVVTDTQHTDPGDSGGPVVAFSDLDARSDPHLVGMVSHGENKHHPALQVRVAAYESWIDGVIAGTAPVQELNCGLPVVIGD